jgi:hypothetical protein
MELHLLTLRQCLTLACLLACLAACEERISIHTDEAAPRLVIYGYITTDTTCHAIRISRSAGYFSTDKPEGLSRADVSIRHGAGVYLLEESREEAGLYLTDSTCYGRVGETYTLAVTLDFDGDGERETYEATSILPPAPILDSIRIQPSTIFGGEAQLLEVLLWGRLPEQEENYFNFHLYRNDILINDSLRGFSVESDLFLANKEIAGLPAFYLNQRRDENVLHPGDQIRFRVEGITRDYGEFISNAQAEARGSVPMFGAPPANVETNIRCLSPTGARLAGYFTAYSTNQAYLTYYP